MRRRLSATRATAALLLPLAIAAGCGHKSAGPAEKAEVVLKPVPVRVAPIEKRAVERTVPVVGTLKGWEDVTIGTKKMGRVSKVHHDMGDRIKPGERLIDLETVDADLAVNQAERRLQSELAKLGLKDMPAANFDVTRIPSVVQAELALERAKINLDRERKLIQKGAGTQQDFQNAENDEKSAEAAYENAVLAARSNLANALASKVALDVAKQARVDMEILAPTPTNIPKQVKSPVVYAMSKRQVAEGQMIREGDAIVELVIENPLRLWMNVPERFAADVALGQDVRIQIASYPNETFQGKVARINPSVDATSRTFQVEAAVPNDDGRLRPGGFAKAAIVTKLNSEALTVPREAIERNSGVVKVFITEDGKTSRAVKVSTGIEGNGWVEVIGGLPETARVVVDGKTQLPDDNREITITTPPTVEGEKKAASVAEPKSSAPAH